MMAATTKIENGKLLMMNGRVNTIRQRAIDEMGGYTMTPLVGNMFNLTNKTDMSRNYYVSLEEKTCTCEAWKKERYCKHQAMVQIWQKREANRNHPDFPLWLHHWSHK